MGAYQGVDRRRETGLLPAVDGRRLRMAATSTAVLAVALLVVSTVLADDLAPGVPLATSAFAAGVFAAVGVACVVLFRVAGDPRAFHLAVASAMVGTSHFVVGLAGGTSERIAAAGALASLAAAAPVARLARTPEVDGAFRPLRAVLLPAVAAAVLGAIGMTGAVGVGTANVLEAAGWLTTAVVVGREASVRRRHLPSWVWLVAAGLGAGALLAVPRTVASTWAESLMLTAMGGIGAGGVLVEVRRAYGAQQRRSVQAMAEAATAAMRAQAVDEGHAERLHEARAALAGIGGAAVTIARYRQLLEPAQFAELSAALVQEVGRLRALIEEDAPVAVQARLDLAAVIAPVVTCARTAGLEVTCEVDHGVVVAGAPEVIAQSLGAVLDNARTHAPGSPVEVSARQEGSTVILSVADRGPGLAFDDPDHAFARGATTGGTGLGLAVARARLGAMHATISASPRLGGGTVFALRLRAAASSSPDISEPVPASVPASVRALDSAAS